MVKLRDIHPSDVPVLLGPPNLDHWSDVLHGLLRHVSLHKHLRHDFPPWESSYDIELDLKASEIFKETEKKVEDKIKYCREQWIAEKGGSTLSITSEWGKKEGVYRSYLEQLRIWESLRPTVVLFIKASLEKVREYLVTAGWKPDVAAAKYHYDFIMREIPKMKPEEVRLKDVYQTLPMDGAHVDYSPNILTPETEKTDTKQDHGEDTATDVKAREIIDLIIEMRPSDYPNHKAYHSDITLLCHQLKHANMDGFERMELWIETQRLKDSNLPEDVREMILAELGDLDTLMRGLKFQAKIERIERMRAKCGRVFTTRQRSMAIQKRLGLATASGVDANGTGKAGGGGPEAASEEAKGK